MSTGRGLTIARTSREAAEAVNRAAGRNHPVTQQISMSVKGDSMSCAINGTTVATYPKSGIVQDGVPRLD